MKNILRAIPFCFFVQYSALAESPNIIRTASPIKESVKDFVDPGGQEPQGSWIPADNLYVEEWQVNGGLINCVIEPYNNMHQGPFKKQCERSYLRRYKEREVNTVTREYRLVDMFVRGRPVEYKAEFKQEEQAAFDLPSDCRFQESDGYSAFRIFTINYEGGFNWFEWDDPGNGITFVKSDVNGNNHLQDVYIYYRGAHIGTENATFNGTETTQDKFQICRVDVSFLPQ